MLKELKKEELTNRMDEFFKRIAEQVNEMIPVSMEYFLFIWRTSG